MTDDALRPFVQSPSSTLPPIFGILGRTFQTSDVFIFHLFICFPFFFLESDFLYISPLPLKCFFSNSEPKTYKSIPQQLLDNVFESQKFIFATSLITSDPPTTLRKIEKFPFWFPKGWLPVKTSYSLTSSWKKFHGNLWALPTEISEQFLVNSSKILQQGHDKFSPKNLENTWFKTTWYTGLPVPHSL